MTPRVVIVLSICALLGADSPQQGPGDKEKLQGGWYLKEWTIGGTARDTGAGEHPDLMLMGDDIFLYGARAGRYKIDPTQTPATFEYTIDARFFRNAGETWLGIYKLEGDVLMVNLDLAPNRPKDFTSRKGTKNQLFLYKRPPLPHIVQAPPTPPAPAPVAGPPAQGPSDKEKLQGGWFSNEWTVGGISPEMYSGEHPDLMFKGDEIYLYGHHVGRYKIDPAKTPATIEYTNDDRFSYGFGKTSLGVYKLEGDVLTINLDKAPNRPKDFESRKGTKNQLFLYKRTPRLPVFNVDPNFIYHPPFEKKLKQRGAVKE